MEEAAREGRAEEGEGTEDALQDRTAPEERMEEIEALLERRGSSFPRGRLVEFHCVWTGRGAREEVLEGRVELAPMTVPLVDDSGSSLPWEEGTTPTTPPVATAEATAWLGATWANSEEVGTTTTVVTGTSATVVVSPGME